MPSQAVTASQVLADPLRNYPAATVACFDPTRGDLPRRELDAERLVGFLERLEGAGAAAALIGASTGHGHLRTAAEMLEWFAATRDASLDKLSLMGLLRPEDAAPELAAQAQAMADAGYSVGFVRPGQTLTPHASPQQMAEHLKPAMAAIADAGLAIGLYSIPDVSGQPLTLEAVLELLDGPFADRLVAMKITEANYDTSTRRFLDEPRCRKLKIVQGWDPHLARALRDDPLAGHDDGSRQVGVTSGPMSFAIFQYLHLLAAATQQDWEEVEASQAAVTALFAAMQDDPQKFADLQRAKFVMGLGQPLLGEVKTPQIEKVLTALRELPRVADQQRLAASLDLMQDGPYHDELKALAGAAT